MQALASEQAKEARDITRTNLFLAATLRTGANGATPVKVRNLSPGGAMLEADALPPTGSAAQLIRGLLVVTGTVVWVAGKRCGLSFDGTVSIKEWMSPPANREQARVDASISALRRHAAPVPPPAPTHFDPEDITIAARLVGQIGDALADDPDMLMRHGMQLQKIDIALQMLGAMGAALGNRPESGSRLADLRASAEQALRSPAG